MKKFVCLISFSIILLPAYSQLTPVKGNANAARNQQYWASWTKHLYENGIEMTNDSIKINEEGKRILLDSGYRKTIYPALYSWGTTTWLLKNMELKKACWYMINLYSADTANKLLVVQSLVPFDQVIEMDKMLTSTFYTYAMLDPKASSLVNGRYQLLHPDVLENNFQSLKELVGYIQYFREKRLQKK